MLTSIIQPRIREQDSVGAGHVGQKDFSIYPIPVDNSRESSVIRNEKGVETVPSRRSVDDKGDVGGAVEDVSDLTETAHRA